MEELINRFIEVLEHHPIAVISYTAVCFLMGNIFGKNKGYQDGYQAGLDSDEKCQNCNKHTINQFYGGK